MTTDAIRLTASMLDARDTMRRFWGDRYDEKVRMYREAIRKSVRPGEELLSAALRVCKRAEAYAESHDAPMVTILCIAATVDECERGSSLSGKDRT